MPPNEDQAIRIMIVDDHAVVRGGVRMLIQSQSRFIVVGEAATSGEALAVAAREQPDIILLDVDLGADRGLDILPRLLEITSARVLLFTASRDTEIHVKAVRLGAMGVVQKDQAIEVLAEAIDRVHRGEAWLEPTLVRRLLTGAGAPIAKVDPEAARIAELTEREREVIALLAGGIQNRDIAERLHIAENTVRRHLAAIFDKLGVDNRLALVLYALRHGLATLD